SNTDAAAYVLESFFYAIETYCSAKANFISDTLLEKAISFYAKLIRSAAGNSAAPMSANAELFAQASILSSLGSSVSSPGFGSALSTAINARTPAARQLCSAVLFPFVAERLVNARPEKMARIASFFTNTKAASIAEAAMSAVDNIRRAMAALNVPSSLKEYNIPLDRLTAAAEAARNLDFVTNSPWPVSEEEVFKILKEII
ncbi:MAG: iron-containing alcohol dehydrogenase, partial [Treponema sp.]|nr:iron-containing alcohol dehydrogenase [Treponema sp.]